MLEMPLVVGRLWLVQAIAKGKHVADNISMKNWTIDC
jgi:hypothetical protein